MVTETGVIPRQRSSAPAPRRRARGGGIHGRQGTAGWLFVTPVIVILGIFLLLPIVMALFVSFTKWNGQGSPFTSQVPLAGGTNYTHLFSVDGLTRDDFMTSLRNTF
ncbi:MAG TPA: hypothetical protein VGJ28_09830, partial [Micromonosporaceae bacterium]